MPTQQPRKRRLSTTTTIIDMPRDVLRLILTRLNDTERLNLSLVSKSVLSLTDSFVNNLRFTSVASQHAFPELLARFSSVTGISIDSDIMIPVLKQVAESVLKIERLELLGDFKFPKIDEIGCLSGKFESVKALKLVLFDDVAEQGQDVVEFKFESLKALKLVCFDRAAEQNVVKFIQLLFPSLQELVCRYKFNLSDFAIEKLVQKPLNLRKISMGLASSSALTNRAFEALTKCVHLEHISFRSWGWITLQGFCVLLRMMKSLKSFELPYNDSRLMMERQDDLLQLVETISLCENLNHLKINNCLVKDDFLRIIARSRSPLTSLEIGRVGVGPRDYTMTGMSAMLTAFQGLTRLHIRTPHPLLENADTQMCQLVKYLPRLKEIFLTSRFAVYATLFSLIQNCQLLEIIHVDCPRHDNDYDLPQEIKRNYSVKCIILYPEPVDAVKVALKLACPSLKIFKFHNTM